MIKNQHIKAIFLMILCTIFASIGQLLWKQGLINIDVSHWLTFFNLPFILGFVSYGVGILFMLLAFKNGELSVIYPIIATSYVWVSLGSLFIFGDLMNTWKWVGVITIVFSVALLGMSGSKKHNSGNQKVIVDG
jgi:uncharacterized membrane protein